MSSGPVLALVLARENAVSYWQELIGPTNTVKAQTSHPDRQVTEYSVIVLRGWPKIFMLLEHVKFTS